MFARLSRSDSIRQVTAYSYGGLSLPGSHFQRGFTWDHRCSRFLVLLLLFEYSFERVFFFLKKTGALFLPSQANQPPCQVIEERPNEKNKKSRGKGAFLHRGPGVLQSRSAILGLLCFSSYGQHTRVCAMENGKTGKFTTGCLRGEAGVKGISDWLISSEGNPATGKRKCACVIRSEQLDTRACRATMPPAGE